MSKTQDIQEIGWLDRHLSDPANRLAFEEEYAVIDASERLLKAVEAGNVTRSRLADLLQTSRANVTQLLNGRRNLTLRTIARIAYFLGFRIRIIFQPLNRPKLEEIPLPELVPIRVVDLSLLGASHVESYCKPMTQTDTYNIGELAA